MKLSALLIGLFCFQCLAADKNKLPELQTKVEPDWGTLTSGYVVDFAEVELAMLPSGEPFSVNSIVPLPDPVVRALAQWRFSKYRKDGADVPFGMIVKVPVRRPINDDYESLQVPQFQIAGALDDATQAASQLSPEEAARLLAKLPKSEAGKHPRISLLAYYSGKGALADPAAARQARRDLIAWFIANEPQNVVLASPFGIVNPSGEPLADPEAIAALTPQWLEVVKQHPGDRTIVNSAINFLRVANPPAAFQVINALPPSSKRSNWLGHVRALEGIGVTAISPAKGVSIAVASSKLPDADGAASRTALLASSDANEVISAMLTTERIAQDLVNHQAAIPQGYDEFCQALLKHTRELYLQTHADCKRPEPVPGGGEVQDAQLARKVQPKYPARAKERGIQGKVEFQAIIGKDGAPRNLELLRGPFALYEESYDSVLQWRWKPTLLNGVPTDIQTEIIVNYALQPR